MMRYDTKVRDERFFGVDRPVVTRGCDCPGCSERGDYRAPKSRDQLDAYYWFCLDHVRAYNMNWDYYAGMNEQQIEAHLRDDSCWQRATWPLGNWRQREAELKEKVVRDFFGDEGDVPPSAHHTEPRHHIPRAVVEALETLELQAPIDFVRIKAQYKVLVKRHHPDANAGSAAAEAKFKDINHAFTVLRKFHEGIDHES
jgi:hypothetical protein